MPIFDFNKHSSIFWVGLSAVAFGQDEEMLPLSPQTRSGSLIRQIEKPFEDDFSFYKTNLVKCVPLKNEKIRYPLEHEMSKCFPNLQDEIDQFNPTVIFLLGKQVSLFVLKTIGIIDFELNENFRYNVYSYMGIDYVPIHHPSYVLVYKRKQVENYIKGIQNTFISSLQPIHNA